MALPYDQTSPDGILAYGARLLGKTLASQPGAQPIPPEAIKTQVDGRKRGYFGDTLERFYFGINPGNESAPDFKEAGVELKSTPIKRDAKGVPSAKERLVLGMIDFVAEAKVERFEDSNLYKKNKVILLVSYEYAPNRAAVLHPIRVVHMLRFHELPDEDQLIIRKDWEKIRTKIRAGKAHELSEGDTDYLGACTKSATSRNRRAQAAGGPPAKPRAFSLKAGYMTVTLRKILAPVVAREYRPIVSEQQSFEEVILARFERFKGMTAKEIMLELKPELNPKQKGFSANLARLMIGAKGHKVEELEKAEILMKIVRVLPSGMPKESMSFNAMRFKNLLDEKWDADEEQGEITSEFREIVERRFLFVTFGMKDATTENTELIFKHATFWNMPYEDRLEAEKVWKRMRDAVRMSREEDFPKESQTPVVHVRPKARTREDTDVLPDGSLTTKRGFWLNKKYLRKILN